MGSRVDRAEGKGAAGAYLAEKPGGGHYVYLLGRYRGPSGFGA